jgi:predicted nucleic acid-binding protein
MVYIDTSVIVKLYIREKLSREMSAWIKTNNEAIPLTRILELEFTNAIYLKQFRSEILDDQVEWVLSKFKEHQDKGIYYYPKLNWSEIWTNSVQLAASHTSHAGSRSLDILHVACALFINADQFFTLDEKQAGLASLAGLELVPLPS